MSEQVLITVIIAFQAVLVAIVTVGGPALIGSIRRLRQETAAISADAAATREQIVNDHTTNFREENDGRHAETLRLFADVRKDIGGIRSDVRQIGQRVTTLEQLEITEPRERNHHDQPRDPPRSRRELRQRTAYVPER